MFYPVFIELAGRKVLVVGGGQVAERKVESLLDAGATVTVVSPDVTQRLNDLVSDGKATLRMRPFQEEDIDGARIVISATNDPETQKQVVAAAAARSVMVNTVDVPDLCDFIVPAVVRRGNVVAAISTSGRSPALAAALKARLEKFLPKDIARAADLLGSVRKEVSERFSDAEQRKRVFERIIDSGIIDWIGECDDVAARQRIRRMIEESD
jgi:precorrin-2 dehydrogenase/sirohydrochlorin ferrochelatase